MDGSAPQSNHIFNAFLPAENVGAKRGNVQLASNSQSPVPTFSSDSHEHVQRNPSFSNPSFSNPSFSNPSSVNTSTQSVAGSATPQMSSKDASFSLLQALLKPQPASSQASQAFTSPQLLNRGNAGSEQVFSQHSEIPSSAMQGGVSSTANATKQSPMEQLKRMIASQNNGIPTQQPQQQYQHAAMQSGQQSNPLSAYSSPRMDTESDAAFSTADTPVAVSTITDDAPSVGILSSHAKNGNGSKKKKTSSMNIDARKIKLRAKPEILPISLLPQPARFRAGRLISVSREYICYAVRSKEGGRIRVIHQMLGKLAKMQGHTDSIVDMAFHPCSREDGMPQILASLGKDNRLIVWLVGPVDLDADSPEGAIAYEPFIDVDSGGDSRFTCLAWRSMIDTDTMELCVGTDKGFVAIKAPVPSSRGKRPDIPNNGMNIMSVSTDSAVTAIERAGSQWVIAATADKKVGIYELDSHWESCSQPYKVVCEFTKCEHPVETLIYVAPATVADGAGHLIIGSLMNKNIQVWWLGNNAKQIEHLQTISFIGAPSKPAPAFVKLSWAEQGRCLTAGASYAPSGIFVFKANGNGSSMTLGFPHGYPLGNDQLTLNLFSAVESPLNGDPSSSVLSIYGVHTRQIQQLQIAGIKPVDYQRLPDPASVYANTPETSPQVLVEQPAPAANTNENTSVPCPLASDAADATTSAREAATTDIPTQSAEELCQAISATLSSQLQSQLAAAFANLNLNESTKQQQLRNVVLDPQAEAKIVERVSAAVEARVTQGMATVMEQTLIPAYNRATAAMFEQMQSTFEAGLREWWTRFAQMMPPHPPPHIATPISHMVMMPQQPQAQSTPLQNVATTTEVPSPAGLQQQQQQQSMPMTMPVPRPMSNVSYHAPMAGNMPSMHPAPAVSSPNASHIESLRNILNLVPAGATPNVAPPQQQ
ncbi:hypothetical protein IW140_000964 [Coemansia sp. RSA 1813]|nr:hypothetical protein EV178_004810 [Coemansia sp. RSA 1646]KAJ1773366.1 hypothetical protein LPJ74_000619 [Coemansia sp. RSA 1843]KAJ2091584.1 hypothetical protein IW138_001812 [Coemansia sp. RSA 986]KAJ2212371.1 hypothetical protein EV179_004696 [Coemansia sp. RSA 487]KAJ2572215.1 hypothetical protein IW140_000964 [Coemansia sp. RSA 1813]